MGHIATPPSLGIGLVGIGHHGVRYARHLLAGVPGAHLAAVCRRRANAPLDIQLPPSVPVHTDPGALVSDPRVHAIVAVVPPAFTPDLCIEAARAGKPILVEKPLAVSCSEARRITAAASAASVPLMTAQTLRFDATLLAMKAARAEIGAPRYLSLASRIETKPRPPEHAAGYGHRGALLEVGVHLTDLVRFLTGEEIVEVRCQIDRPPPEPETLATATLRTASGMPCLLEVARVAAGRTGRAEWIGAAGQLVADWHHGTLETAAAGAPPVTRSIPSRPTVIAALTAFVTSVRDATPPPIAGEDGLRAVEIVEACYRSAERGAEPVTLPLDSR